MPQAQRPLPAVFRERLAINIRRPRALAAAPQGRGGVRGTGPAILFDPGPGGGAGAATFRREAGATRAPPRVQPRLGGGEEQPSRCSQPRARCPPPRGPWDPAGRSEAAGAGAGALPRAGSAAGCAGAGSEGTGQHRRGQLWGVLAVGGAEAPRAGPAVATPCTAPEVQKGALCWVAEAGAHPPSPNPAPVGQFLPGTSRLWVLQQGLWRGGDCVVNPPPQVLLGSRGHRGAPWGRSERWGGGRKQDVTQAPGLPAPGCLQAPLLEQGQGHWGQMGKGSWHGCCPPTDLPRPLHIRRLNGCTWASRGQVPQ